MRTLKFNPKSAGGFSLIEISIVIVLIAIVASIAVSIFTKSAKNRNLKEAAGALMSDIKHAKQRAMAEGAKYRITLNNDMISYTVHKLDPTDSTDNTVISSAKKDLSHFGDGVKIKSYTGGDSIVCVTRGTCSPGKTIVLVHATKSEIEIIVSTMGRVRSVEKFK
jgi:prepilin-type N-terminal cleavage/methylation domain-containing protein